MKNAKVTLGSGKLVEIPNAARLVAANGNLFVDDASNTTIAVYAPGEWRAAELVEAK